MTEPTIRPAAAADYDAIVDLVTSAYRGESSTAGWTTEHDLIDGGRTTPELVAAAATAAGSVVLVVEGEQSRSTPQLVGCIEVSHEGDTARFGMLAVAPATQSGGLGSALIGAAERWAAEQWGCTAMELGVITLRSELIAFYERRGYRTTGATVPFPYGDERYGVPRRDDLSLQVMRRPLD